MRKCNVIECNSKVLSHGSIIIVFGMEEQSVPNYRITKSWLYNI